VRVEACNTAVLVLSADEPARCTVAAVLRGSFLRDGIAVLTEDVDSTGVKLDPLYATVNRLRSLNGSRVCIYNEDGSAYGGEVHARLCILFDRAGVAVVTSPPTYEKGPLLTAVLIRSAPLRTMEYDPCAIVILILPCVDAARRSETLMR
jgi:hypothetical protein